jgi:DNA polymerase III, epsilon subunit and related 3''-5'' exonucleases
MGGRLGQQVVDVEITGLNACQYEIIELAITPFSYGLDGTIFTVGESFQGLQQPRAPIPHEIGVFGHNEVRSVA